VHAEVGGTGAPRTMGVGVRD